MVVASRGFIGVDMGAGVGTGSSIVWRGRVGPSAGACSGAPEQVEHVDICFCPGSNAC